MQPYHKNVPAGPEEQVHLAEVQAKLMALFERDDVDEVRFRKRTFRPGNIASELQKRSK